LSKFLFSSVVEVEETKRNKNKTSIPSSVLKKGNQLFLHQTPTTLTIHEDVEQQQKDEVNDNLHSSFSNSAPPPVAPRLSRQNSACSTQSSVRYAS